MLSGTYDVAIDTPKAHKRGLFALKLENGSVTAELEIKDFDTTVFAGRCNDKELQFEGVCDFPTLGNITYSATGEVWGNSLSLAFDTSAGKVEIFGTRLSGTAGDTKSSHEYMMSGASGDFGSDDNTMYSGLFGDGG